MAEKLTITDIEFESIKANLKEFMRTRDTFKDYDFEGSALSQLIGLLAYNTYYNSFYTNMTANELFLDSAQVRNSLLSHAKSLNYTPVSRRAPVAIVRLTVTPPSGNTQSILTLDRFREFQSGAIDGVNHTFVTTQAYSVYKEQGVFPFPYVELRAGTPQVLTFVYDALSNPKAFFELPDDTIDTSTLLVIVQASGTNTSSEVFTLSTDITQSDANTAVFYLSTTTSNKYQVSFGDHRVSKGLTNDNIVYVSYLSTDGEQANRANSFATGAIGGFSNVSIASVSAASGGAEREGDESIRRQAPLSYTAQQRAVTRKDYETLLKSRYPDIQSIFVWGGEDNIPPVYGKVFVSIAPKEGVILNQAEKARIVADILDPISIVTVTPELVDPDYVFMKFEVNAEVDGKKTTLTSAQIGASIWEAITGYADTTLNQFGAIFTISQLGSAVDQSLPAIIGSSTSIRLEKRFTPVLNVATTYEIKFNTPLHQAPIQKSLKSTAFSVYDTAHNLRTAYLEEVFNSSTGVDSIDITNPGYDYVDPPTVTITGDGTGAMATATIVNGRIERITVTRRGTSYTSALVTISGGGGKAATASAVVQSKYGTMRLYYFNNNSEKVDINPAIGTIDYSSGIITISELNVVDAFATTGEIRLSVEPDSSIIETQQNQLLTLDSTDSSSLTISVDVR